MIRQDSHKKRRRHSGDDGQELCDGPAAPYSRPRSEAERTPTSLLTPRAPSVQHRVDDLDTVTSPTWFVCPLSWRYLMGRKKVIVGLRTLFNKHKKPASSRPVPFTAQAVVDTPLTPEQLADLDSARAELLQLAAEVASRASMPAPRHGSRWQDDPKTIRTIKETHLKDESSGLGSVR